MTKNQSHDFNFDDLTQECLDAYRKAAEYDDYMFGNTDDKEEWIGISTSK